MRVAGIDPGYGKKCAIAVVNEDESLIYLDSFSHSQASIEIGLAHKAVHFEQLFIEDTYLGKNVATLKKLSMVVGYIESACMLLEISVAKMAASTWQSALPGYSKTYGKERETLVIKLAHSMVSIPKKRINIDEAAAIHIALKGMRIMKLQETIK